MKYPKTANLHVITSTIYNVENTEKVVYCLGSSFLIRAINLSSELISEINGFLSFL